SHLGQATNHLPQAISRLAKSSVGAGYAIAHRLPPVAGQTLLRQVESAFLIGLHAGCYVAAGMCALGVLGALALPGSPPSTTEAPAPPALA
ncbi:MAG: hypothetical protein JOY58_19570, partial [Solirubrobacterales bacterium]|nr:hypothetical protein [Solirubrobacterales bacterium]